ncbi:MAG: DUF362 domain-containing protein [Actinobacteria bacterium]|nr:DUF362 domain-containing protein [Actinomycetota bacterium]
MIADELEALELPEETEGYRLEERGGESVLVEKRRDMLDPKARVFIGRMSEKIPADVGDAIVKVGARKIISEGTLVAIKINLGGGVNNVPTSYTDLLVAEGLIDKVRELGGRPFVCEANMRSMTMNRRMLTRRGLYPLLLRKGAEFVNLSETADIDFHPLGWETPIRLARPLLHPDVKVISVPALKHHWECAISLAQKNMYGAIAERQKSIFHRSGTIDETVAAAARAVTPDISLLAHRQVGGQLGPHFCIPIDFGYIIASDNVLAADYVGCDFLGTNWRDVKHLQINCNGQEIPFKPVKGSVEIDVETKQRIAKTAISPRRLKFWRSFLFPQYWVPHKTQYQQTYKIEPLATWLNWLFFHSRGDPWQTQWRPPFNG